MAGLGVLGALFVLISEDRGTFNGSPVGQQEQTRDLNDVLIQAIMLQRLRSNYGKDASEADIINAQRILRDNGVYSGPVDGKTNKETRDAIRSFQKSQQLDVSGIVDRETAQRLALFQQK